MQELSAIVTAKEKRPIVKKSIRKVNAKHKYYELYLWYTHIVSILPMDCSAHSSWFQSCWTQLLGMEYGKGRPCN